NKMDYNKIFSGEEPIFFDCCGITGDHNWYNEAVRPFSDYRDLNSLVIANEIEHVKTFFPFLVDPQRQIFFTPKVVKEVRGFRRLLERKAFYLEDRKGISPRAIENRKLFLGIKKAYEILAAVVPENEYKIDNKKEFYKYNKLLIQLGKKYGAKIKSKEYDKTRYKQENHIKDNHADEELVACALFHTLQNNVSCGIITRDRDLSLLFKFGLRYFFDNPGYENELKTLSKTPVWIYDILRESILSSDERISFYNALKERAIPGSSLEEKVALP
ncbi:MAG: hypothetical protein Q8L27_01765, partial [archaeon]|nr:hypothetical protein [archaeon]